MLKVIDCFHIGNYAILILNNAMPENHGKVIINSKEHFITIPYDIKNASAIESDLDFSGCSVEFLQ